MRKIFLFSAFSVFAILGCGGDSNMPCATCNDYQSSPSSSYVYCLYDGSCNYTSVSECNRIGGTAYGNYEDCVDDYYSSSSSSYSSSSSSYSPSSSSYSYSSEYTGGSCNVSDYGAIDINGQIWMAKNWGCYAPGSKCYDNDPANCATYGRLYDWATAMALPDCGYGSSCASQIGANHRGICPSNWHIPSNADWDKLYRYVDGSTGTSSPYYSRTAGEYLKATSGWNLGNGGRNGEDTYGFSALPGGSFWWSASEDGSYNAYLRYMSHDYESAGWNNLNKDKLFSVRCLQDYSSGGGLSSSVSSSSSSHPSSSSISYQTLDGCPNVSVGYNSMTCGNQTYKTVDINGKIWMAENLNYNASGSKCQRNDPSNCTTYGRLYDWATAMSLPSDCNFSTCWQHRGICPSGWHIPSEVEWDVLVNYAGGYTIAGTKLKSKSGWDTNIPDPSYNGTDDYGFAALPGGYGYSDGSFGPVGGSGYWWSATEYYNDASSFALVTLMYRDYAAYVGSKIRDKSDLYSVRCVQD